MTAKFYQRSRSSSAILAPYNSNHHGDTIDQFMRTSWYLPVDILKNEEWIVDKIAVVTGAQFWINYEPDYEELHCQEDYELLSKACFVGLSYRTHRETGRTYIVAKIWYGEIK